ncbi:Toxin-antitoxin system antitoxin component family [uncultured Pleomorphomonas sp.]|uniref:Toxin-antitoxin system antitoxin component family n=2 Tax=uncultured Pleomorphomonas sp. TaxID=442121 RepID=A0A212L1I2_9HYPH|nr:Toxin-antitoxin system antitoxin component family [uncultured Pleomorphomonas sp.]
MSIEAVKVVEIVGGERTLGKTIRNTRDLIAAVRAGFPAATVEYVVDAGKMSLTEVDFAVMPRKTLTRRRKAGMLTAEQSDRLVRVARVIALAEETFGSPDKAKAWLRRETSPLGGVSPMSLLDTTEGAAQVEQLLNRIAYGVAA